ncbi:MAG TPA: hypothetical protein VF516_42990 [Kofleriaceae bacterium]
MVPQVTIESVDAQNVSFWTRSDSKTGDPNERLRRLFTVAVKEVWTAPIPGQPAPVEMKPGATGPLFLSKTGWQTTTPDGYHILGAGTDAVAFKLPACLAAAPFQGDLTVIPSKLVVQGYPEGKSELVQIDLLGPDAAESQDLRWHGSEYLEIRLAEHASGPSADPHDGTVKVWPTQILVSGSAKSAPAISGEVDLLDGNLAAHAQHIQFAQRGTPISLVLTQNGFGAFHVVPGM